MDFAFRKAAIGDFALLTESRVKVLRAANGLSEDTDMSEVRRQSRRYYEKTLRDGTHAAWLVFDGSRLIGTGGVSFFQVMPTYHNPSGYKAYLMNLYTDPAYRRRGIAFQTLDRLVREARGRGVTAISLEATSMGRPLYEKYGFVRMNDEMELPEAAFSGLGRGGMTLREYRPADGPELARLFYDTVHTINARDYTEEQLNAWAAGQVDLEEWNRTLTAHYSLVAVEEGRIIGFGDMDRTGYLDRLYVHRDHQRRGVASAICAALEQAVRGTKIVTHASVTARPFFEKRGYRTVRSQTVERRGVGLTNFVMEKNL